MKQLLLFILTTLSSFSTLAFGPGDAKRDSLSATEKPLVFQVSDDGRLPAESVYYRYDSLSDELKPLPLDFKPLPFEAFSFDPVRFTLRSNKESVAIGEEFEITITAEYLDVNPNLMFTFEGANEYTLKMLMPRGFVQTGGDYYDYVQGVVNRERTIINYVVKGFYEYESGGCFTLLRGGIQNVTNGLFEKKDVLCLNTFLKRDVIKSLRGVNSGTGVESLKVTSFTIGSDFCDGLDDVTFLVDIKNESNATVESYVYIHLYGGSSTGCFKSEEDMFNYFSFGTTSMYKLVSIPPNSTLNGVQLIYPKETIVPGYDHHIDLLKGTVDNCVNGNVSLTFPDYEPPIHSVNEVFVCEGSTYTLPEPSCSSGEVVWEGIISPTIVVTEEKVYRARCCNSELSSGISVRLKKVPSKPVVTVPGCLSSSTGEKDVAVISCEGNVTWSNGVTTYSSPHLNKYPVGTGYWATCSNSCGPSEADHFNVEICTPTLQIGTSNLCPGQTTYLSAQNCSGTPTFEFLSGSTWSAVANSASVGAGTYRVRCSNQTSESKTISSTSAPGTPTIQVENDFACGPQAVKLFTEECVSGTVVWSDGQTGHEINVQKSDTYTAHCETQCGTQTYSSLESNSITTTYSSLCSCDIAQLSGFPADHSVVQGSNLILTATFIEGVSYTWNIPSTTNASYNAAGNELTISDFQAANVGLYSVTLNCKSEPLEVNLSLEPVSVNCDFSSFSAYSNTEHGEVGVDGTIQLLANGGDTYNWWKHNSDGSFWSPERAPRIENAQLSDAGTYQVEISKTVNGTVCKQVKNVPVVISACNLDAYAYFYESGSNFVLQGYGNLDYSNTTIQWWKDGQFKGESWQVTLPKNDLNRGTYYARIQKGSCIKEIPVEVDYVATPVYSGSVYAISCDRIYGGVIDQANAYKSLQFNLTVIIDGDHYVIPVSQPGDGSAASLYFNVPEKYKNGLPHDVIVRNPYGQEVANFNETSFQCCTLSFEAEPVTSCLPDGTGQIEVIGANGKLGSGYQFSLSKQSYNEEGNQEFELVSDWSTADESILYENLENAYYLVEVRESHTENLGCATSTVVPLYCSDTPEDDCEEPILTVFPGTTVREGEGVIPVIYADVPAINTSDEKEGLILDGNSSLSIGTRTYLEGNFSVDALVNPDQGKSITLGDISESSTQRYLYKSWNGDIEDKVGANLSVGSNGINLIEVGNNGSKRLVFSHAIKLVGWNHIAVTYENNKARLLINGQLVKTSDKAPSSLKKVVGPSSIGTDLNRGFSGAMYTFRIWNQAMSDLQMAQLKNNFSPALATEPNIGFWVFDKSSASGIIEDLSTHKRQAKKEGLAYVLEPSEPVTAPTAPVIEWWHNGVQVASGNKYKLPASKVKEGVLNYVAKYQKTDGTYCEADVDITVEPIIFGALSGCYYITPQYANENNNGLSPYFNTNENRIRLKFTDYSVNFEKKIFKFEHLGSEEYRIVNPFYEEKALEIDGNELFLRDKRSSSVAQQWIAEPINAAGLIFALESKASAGSYLEVNSPNAGIASSVHSGTTFKMVPTSCPLPPSPCVVDNKVTFERYFQESLADYWYNEFQALDAPQFIENNEGYQPVYVHEGDIGTIAINRDKYAAMGTPKPDLSTMPDWVTVGTDNLWVGRISGYFCPPDNGDYRFYIKSDEWSAIYMSTDEDPQNKRRIAYNEYYSPDYTSIYTQVSDPPISLSKGRSYYFEVVFKDQANSFFVDVAWQKGGGSITALTTEHFSSRPRDLPPGNFSISANKTEVAPTESSTITATGCYYGKIVWRYGTTIVQDPVNSIPFIQPVGPGTYQAICMGDPSVRQDWQTVVIESNTNIVPIISGPDYACESENINLSVSGKPATDWTVKWYILKDEDAERIFRENSATFNLFETSPELFNNPTGDAITVTGPGTYYAQIISPGGWTSEVREITVGPAFPADLEASNNGPVELGGTLTLASAFVPAGTSYTWAGPGGFSQTGRNVARPSFTEDMAGIYTLTITTAGTCSFTGTTQVSAANCDIYIEGKNEAGEETYTLERTAGVPGSFEPVWITIKPYVGTSDFSAYNIEWFYEGDPLSSAPKSPTIQVTEPGDYRAVLSLKMNPANICETEVHISGKPCNVFGEGSGICGPVDIPLPDGLSEGVSVAPGDEFTVADYTVVITEITSGSKAGWWGKGYVAMRLVNGITASKISITFEDAVINECYELAAGRVLTEYDPNWGGVLDVDAFIDEVQVVFDEAKTALTGLLDKLNNLDCDDESSFTEFTETLSDQKDYFGGYEFFTSTQQTEISDGYENILAGAACILENCGSSSARMGNLRSSSSALSFCSIEALTDEVEDVLNKVDAATATQEELPDNAESGCEIIEEVADKMEVSEVKFVIPDGRLVSLGSGDKLVKVLYEIKESPAGSGLMPQGVINGFVKNGKKYVARIHSTGGHNEFSGFYDLNDWKKSPVGPKESTKLSADNYTNVSGTSSEIVYIIYSDDLTLLKATYSPSSITAGQVLDDLSVSSQEDLGAKCTNGIESATVQDYGTEAGLNKLQKEVVEGVSISITTKEGDKWLVNSNGKFKASEGIEVSKNKTHFEVTEDASGHINITAAFDPKGCSACASEALSAFNQAFQHAKDSNGGYLTLDGIAVPETKGSAAPLYGMPGTNGGIEYEAMDLGDWLTTIAETYNEVLSSAKMPEKVWRSDLPSKVKDKTIVFSGAVDGVINEATEKAQLVGLALTVVSDPIGTAEKVGSFVTDLDWDDVDDLALAIGAGVTGFDQNAYDAGGDDRTHNYGQVAGTLASTLGGGFVTEVVASPSKIAAKLANVLALLDRLRPKLKNLSVEDVLKKDLGKKELYDALDADVDLVESWELLHKGVRSKLKLDPSALNKVKELLGDAKVQQVLGPNYFDELSRICGAHGGFKGAKSLVDYLEDVKVFFNKYDGKESMSEMLNSMKNSNSNVQDGLQHTLNQMNLLNTSSVKRFDLKFEVEGIDCSNCRFDVELFPAQTGGLKYIEYKSYSDASKIQISQFKSYLSSIGSLNELKYVFNVSKLSEVEAKSGMITLLNSPKNKSGIFQSMSTSLKQTLNVLDVSDIDSNKIEQIVNAIVIAQ